MTARCTPLLAALLAASAAHAQYVRAWGADSYGQTTVPADLGTVIDVSHGGSHLLAVTTGGQVRAWGRDTSGQATVPPTLGIAIAVAAGGQH